jgi:predicted metal-dependent hydrolase
MSAQTRNGSDAVTHPYLQPLPIVVVRSKKRRKTVQAVLDDGVIRVLVPHGFNDREIDDSINDLVPRLERKFRSDHVDLMARAATLAHRFDLPRPTSVVWAENQRKRWGSCDTRTGDIRMSIRLAEFPPWVLDYVLVHELTHLVIRDHSPAFRALVDRYPRAERARGYLLAMHDRSDAPTSPDRPVIDDGGAGGPSDIDDIDDLDGSDAGWDQWPEDQGHLPLDIRAE